MSRRIGPPMDAALRALLSGDGAARHHGEAILVATADGRGRPHPALLTPAEVAATGPDRLRLAVGERSATARNLAERGAVTLALVEGGRVLYVKARTEGRIERAGLPAGLAVFAARVEDVLVDEPAPGEDILEVSGFRYVARDAAAHRAAAARVAVALRGDEG